MIKDISGMVDIASYTWVVYLAVATAVVVAIIVIFFIIKILLKKRKENVKRGYIRELKGLDLTNSKDSAYKITNLTKLLIDSDNSKLVKMRGEVVESLAKYKYKKSVEAFSSIDRAMVDSFMKEIFDEYKF